MEVDVKRRLSSAVSRPRTADERLDPLSERSQDTDDRFADRAICMLGGSPWFNTNAIWPRRGPITSVAMSLVQPALARGVLTFLAATQATETASIGTPSPARFCMRHARRARRYRRILSGATTAASIARRCCRARRRLLRANRSLPVCPGASGRPSKQRSTGSITTVTATVTASSNMNVELPCRSPAPGLERF